MVFEWATQPPYTGGTVTYVETYRGYDIYFLGHWGLQMYAVIGPNDREYFNMTLAGLKYWVIDDWPVLEPEPEPAWEYHSTYRGIDIQVWMPDGTPYTAYFDDEWHMAALLSTLQAAIDDFLEPEPTGIPTTTTLSAPDKAGLGENFNISGILYETETGIPISNQPINHSYNGRSLGGSTTGADGGYLKAVSVPESGTWTLKSEFPGTPGLQASRSQSDAVVGAPPLKSSAMVIGSTVTGLALVIYGLS